MVTWTNGDGLYLKYGTDEATAGRGGQYTGVGPLEVENFKLTLSGLTTSAETIISDVAVIPKGAIVQRVDILVLTASAGANANLDIGLVDLDRTSNAVPQALVAAGDDWHTGAAGTVARYELGTNATEAGSQLGLPQSNSARLVTVGAETAVFSAGVIEIRLYWKMPG